MSRPWVTIVSGVPRSGTSLVMQMLAAGGLPLLYGGGRAADVHNPRGYFELAAIAATRRDVVWIEQALGRAVKVVASFVPDLPPDRTYRILLLRRAADEVWASQRAMLGEGNGDGVPERWAERWKGECERAVQWAAAAPRAALLELAHARLLGDPTGAAAEIARFLGGGLDREAMMRAVDPALHRQRF